MKLLYLGNGENNSLTDFLTEVCDEVVFISERITIDDVIKYSPDYIVSYNYRYIIKKDIIKLLKNRIINLHISYLPWNRGSHPNVWSHLEDTPNGITIHYIDEGIDTGDIIIQKEISFSDEDTLKTSHYKLNTEIQKLLIENWDNIINNSFKPKPQVGNGTFHLSKELEEVWSCFKQGWDTRIKDIKTLKKGI